MPLPAAVVHERLFTALCVCAPPLAWLRAALEVSPHHVFVGDSSGVLHVYRSEATTQHLPK